MVLDNNEKLVESFKHALKQSNNVKISTGYFSTNIFRIFKEEFSNYRDTDKKIQIIIGSDTSVEEITLLQEIEKFSTVKFSEKIIDMYFSNLKELDEEILLLLHNLFVNNILEIRIGYLEGYGVYHSKYYIFENPDGTAVINGSLNFTTSALFLNHEVVELRSGIDVFEQYSTIFTKTWNNIHDTAKCSSLRDYILLALEAECKQRGLHVRHPIQANINLRDYQEEAIASLLENDFNGFFKMATGTGKTFTALYGVNKYSELSNKNKIVHIVVPYKHLASQWKNSIEDLYGENAFVFEAHGEVDWKHNLGNISMEISTKDCFAVFVNKTYFDNLNYISQKINESTILIVDEAHNLTVSNLEELDEATGYNHRLGLSATPEHYLENERTEQLFRYFHGAFYEYNLADAINNGYLTKYNYFPYLINLNTEERSDYLALNMKIKNEANKNIVLNLLEQRNMLLSKATSKMSKLKELIKENKIDKTLIYCYQGKVKGSDDYTYIQYIGEQIKDVDKQVILEKITSNESRSERMKIVDNLVAGRTNAILAIKCLDEGFDIPAIKDAYILSSTQNPKEFIQRRGRVLRKYPGKTITNIYDFIVAIDDEVVLAERDRFDEYASLAENQEFINEFRMSNQWEKKNG
ncbi:DEAD/DEAH box helicase family protein [Mollicutes bacterium LVI A0039]|nr:DEAD/DEAH box helicase family protein [Mollicutes bacterium LVI A0039]